MNKWVDRIIWSRFWEILAISALVFGMTLGGCKMIGQKAKSFKTSTIGAHRIVTLYAVDGTPIKSWEGRYQLKVEGGAARFIHEGKVITISGTWLAEEE